MATVPSPREHTGFRNRLRSKAQAELLQRQSVLESDLGGELDAAGAASTQERIADSHVAGRGQGVRTDSTPRAADAVHPGIGDEVRKHRIGEVGMIEQVEKLSAQLQVDALGDLGVFEQGEVELLEPGPLQL